MYQLFFTDGRGSLLTSAIITAYASYICFSSVSLNPKEVCNPTIGGNSQNVSQVVGMVITTVSLTWTTYGAVSTIDMSNAEQNTSIGVRQPAFINEGGSVVAVGEKPTGGPSSSSPSQASPAVEHSGVQYVAATEETVPTIAFQDTREKRAIYMQVSMVFMLISAYYAMVLTNWSEIVVCVVLLHTHTQTYIYCTYILIKHCQISTLKNTKQNRATEQSEERSSLSSPKEVFNVEKVQVETLFFRRHV